MKRKPKKYDISLEMFKLTKAFITLTLATILCLNIGGIYGEKVRVVELTNTWNLRNQNGSIQVAVSKIPSGVYTAVKSLFGDVLHSQNDVDLRWIAYDNWTYSNTFKVNQADFEHVSSVNLTLYGVDTIAVVRLNDREIGKLDNMFVRYSIDVLPYLYTEERENTLEIEIFSPVLMAKQRADALMENNINSPPNCPHERTNGECHRNMLRKMQASFGNDWTLAAPSMGIWKIIALEYYDVAIMRDVDVALRKNATHWVMDMRVFLSTSLQEDFYGELTFHAADLLENPVNVSRRLISYASPILEFKVEIPKDNVVEWWPNGYGVQKLYSLFFSMNVWLQPEGPKVRSKRISQKSLKIGFRTIEVVEDLDDKGRTFYFKVNGYPIFIKGANYIPTQILPELSGDTSQIKHILQSAKESHMNMIRVTGGGLYESDYFYNLADYYGLLVWQDMAFAASTYPITDEFVQSVRIETVQNAQRIAYHPSLALITTNSEIELFLVKNRTDLGHDSERLEEEYKQLFLGTIKHDLNIISRNDFNPRAGPMMSTPSAGIEEGKKGMSLDPQNINCGDIHFWECEKNGWDPDIYTRGRFVTEFGYQSLPKLVSWERTMDSDDDIVHLIRHRQHDAKAMIPMLQLIARHLPLLPTDWENNIEQFIYFSQVAQAMAVKTGMELYRSLRANNHTMGAIYWQINDNWVAPTWSSIDFYGNYKILYYWSKEFLAPTIITALYDSKARALNVTLMRDGITVNRDERIYDVTMNIYLWSELYPKKTISWQAVMDSNSIQTRVFEIDSIIAEPFTVNNCFLEFILSESSKVHSSTFYFPGTISNAVGMMDPELNINFAWRYCNALQDETITSYSLTIYVKYPALFVYIEINHPDIVTYKLSHNGFVQVESVKTVHLEFSHQSQCLTLTLENIKIVTINQFMIGNAVTFTPSSTATSIIATLSDIDSVK